MKYRLVGLLLAFFAGAASPLICHAQTEGERQAAGEAYEKMRYTLSSLVPPFSEVKGPESGSMRHGYSVISLTFSSACLMTLRHRITSERTDKDAYYHKVILNAVYLNKLRKPEVQYDAQLQAWQVVMGSVDREDWIDDRQTVESNMSVADISSEELVPTGISVSRVRAIYIALKERSEADLFAQNLDEAIAHCKVKYNN